MDTLRLVLDPPLTGFENMSRDQAMLDLAVEGDIPPTVRFFQWDKPTLTIGKLQKVESLDIIHLEHRSIPLVRRPTGGRAILHHHEVTFSMFLPPFFFGAGYTPAESYEKLRQVLLLFLEILGITPDQETLNQPYLASPYCFSLNAAHEITVKGKKLIGVAQARNKGGTLFQGSCILSADRKEIAGGFHDADTVLRELSHNLLALDEILNRVPERDTLIDTFLESFAREWSVMFRRQGWIEEEIACSADLMRTHYFPGSSFIMGKETG